MSSKKKPARHVVEWGDAHRREAFRALLRISDAYAPVMPMPPTGGLHIFASHIDTENGFRGAVIHARAHAKSYGVTMRVNVNREVRRVRALAEGRLVREPVIRGHRIAFPGGGRSSIVTKQQALDGIDPMRTGAPDLAGRRIIPVRVTRIRKADAR